MALPFVDFTEIDALAKESIQLYGSPATYEFHDGGTQLLKTVIYKDTFNAEVAMDFDLDSAKGLLDPADFPTARKPERFDNIIMDIAGYKKTYTIEQIAPIFAESTNPLIIVNLRAN